MVKILDTTLRDGSYAVDYQFTTADTALLSWILDRAGIPYIEIGHGLGLNASAAGKGRSAASDLAYLEAALSSIQSSKVGMFCIPGIATTQHLKNALSRGMHFARIGVNITELDTAREYISTARANGCELVFCNLMKSYAVSPSEFAKATAKANAWGADVAVLVDSAGGFLPQDVTEYMYAARQESSIELGYHGHDNLSLGVANTVQAVQSGASIVDTSLRGLGRSAGNAATEVVISVLKRMGQSPDVDIRLLQNAGDELVGPLLNARGKDSIAITSGHAQFHSSFLGTLKQYAQRYDIDVRDLIENLCQKDKVNAPEQLVENIARNLASDNRASCAPIPQSVLHPLLPQAPPSLEDALDNLLKSIRSRAAKTHLRTVLNVEVVLNDIPTTRICEMVQEGFGCVVGAVQPVSQEDLRFILAKADGRVDAILLDVENKAYPGAHFAAAAHETLSKSLLFLYCDSEVWARAIRDQILNYMGTVFGKQICILGDNNVSKRLKILLTEMGAATSIQPLEENTAHVIVGLEPGTPVVTAAMTNTLVANGLVIDGGIGSLAPDVPELCSSQGITVQRVDMRAALAAEAASKFGTHFLQSHVAGRAVIANKGVVAGGTFGDVGDIVLDRIDCPTHIVGIADGRGGVLGSVPPEYLSDLMDVWSEIVQNKLFSGKY